MNELQRFAQKTRANFSDGFLEKISQKIHYRRDHVLWGAAQARSGSTSTASPSTWAGAPWRSTAPPRTSRPPRSEARGIRSPTPAFFGCIQEETSCIKTEHFSDKDMCPRKTNESSKYTSRNIARKIIVGVRYVWVAYRFGDTTLALEQIVDPCGAGAQPSLAGKAGWYVRSGHKVSHSDNASLGVSPSIFSW